MTAPVIAAARPLVRRTARAARFWLVLGGLILLGGVILALAQPRSKAPLDPTSPAHSGSLALATLMGQRGTSVHKLTAPADAASAAPATTVLIVDPSALGDDQLRAITATHRTVLLDPGHAALAAVTSLYDIDAAIDATPVEPGCAWSGAQSAGPITYPYGAGTYSGPSTCYEATVVVTDRLVVLGSSSILENDHLADNNIAALDINAISADGAVSDVAWLLPSVHDTGGGTASVWDLFPEWTHRAFWWLLAVGLLTALWRGRRFGPVIAEPLPVVVRAAEVVEGHGRLYRRANARERAAGLLRAATANRLARRMGLDRHAGPVQVAAVLGQRDPGLTELLTGAPPADDAALMRLAADLAVVDARTTMHPTDPLKGPPS